MKYTKVELDFYIKEFPIGQILRCIIWYDDSLLEYEIKENLDNYQKNNHKKISKYVIAGFKIINWSYHNEKEEKYMSNSAYIQNKKYYDIKKDNITNFINDNLLDDLSFRKMNIRNRLS